MDEGFSLKEHLDEELYIIKGHSAIDSHCTLFLLAQTVVRFIMRFNSEIAPFTLPVPHAVS